MVMSKMHCMFLRSL